MKAAGVAFAVAGAIAFVVVMGGREEVGKMPRPPSLAAGIDPQKLGMALLMIHCAGLAGIAVCVKQVGARARGSTRVHSESVN